MEILAHEHPEEINRFQPADSIEGEPQKIVHHHLGVRLDDIILALYEPVE